MALCIQCCTNEATAFTTDGESLCEVCRLNPAKNEAERIKDASNNHCIGRDSIHGCLIWAEVGSNLCGFCKQRQMPDQRARIKRLPTSARPCQLKAGCPGQMVASVRRYYKIAEPELWWHCPICGIGEMAEKTTAVPDDPSQDYQGEFPGPLNIDVADMSAHIRSIQKEEDRPKAQNDFGGAED